MKELELKTNTITLSEITEQLEKRGLMRVALHANPDGSRYLTFAGWQLAAWVNYYYPDVVERPVYYEVGDLLALRAEAVTLSSGNLGMCLVWDIVPHFSHLPEDEDVEELEREYLSLILADIETKIDEYLQRLAKLEVV